MAEPDPNPDPRAPFGPVPPALRRRSFRRAVRVIVRADDRVLLLLDSDPDVPERLFWLTPGGGIDPGETELQAAVRELAEETGLVVDPAELRGPLTTRLVVHGYSDAILEQIEQFYLLDVAEFELDSSGLTAEEQITMQGHRWWPIAELRHTDEWIWPADLVSLIEHDERDEPPQLPDTIAESTLRVDDCDAVLLGGGTARRLGGVSKPELLLAGRRLIDIAIEAVQYCRAIVAVVPTTVSLPAPIRRTLEDPPLGGPVAGLAAGLAELACDREPADLVLLVACDLPGVGPALDRLAGALPDDADGVCLVAADGRPQWLAGLYRRSSLLAQLEAGARDRAMHELLADLTIAQHPASPAELQGVDHPADLATVAAGGQASSSSASTMR